MDQNECQQAVKSWVDNLTENQLRAIVTVLIREALEDQEAYLTNEGVPCWMYSGAPIDGQLGTGQ